MDKTFRPTVEWMAAKYAEMNEQLFGGQLGQCDFDVFTTGRGSEGGTLGWFKVTTRGLRADRYSRRMYKVTFNGWSDKIYVDRKNFYDMCRPKIELNGNYFGTEHGFLATLVHEMCHYYTYMNGYVPKQGHGREFKEIGYIVSSRSNGLFTIQRLATAEEMNELELNDEMKAKRAKREANKKANATALVIYKKDGQVRLILTRSENLIYEILGTEEKRKDTVKVIRTSDQNVIELCFNSGFKKLMRSYRFWNINNKKDILEAIDNSEYDELYENPDLVGVVQTSSKPTQTLGIGNHQPQPQQQTPQEPKMIFSIKTSNGVFETPCNSFVELREKLQQRFPNMSYETISKLMGNRANFKKLEENTMTRRDIIKEVIDEFMRNEFRGANNMDDSIEINPDMNLGLHSPLEME